MGKLLQPITPIEYWELSEVEQREYRQSLREEIERRQQQIDLWRKEALPTIRKPK